MSKKIVQTANNGKNVGNANKNTPVVKKKHGCRNCLLSLLVFVVVINVATFFVGDYFAKKYIGVGGWDILSIAQDMRFVNKKKVVTTPYTSADLSGFNAEFKKQLFLKSDVDFNVSDLIVDLLPAGNSGGDVSTQQTAKYSDDYLSRTVSALGTTSAPAADILTTIANVFSLDNLDKERLSGYDETRHKTDYTFKLNDKQFAALINSALDDVLANVDTSFLADFGIEKLTDVMALEQIIFAKEGEDDIMKATISIKVRDIAKKFIKTKMPFDFSFVSYPLLPKDFYITAQLKLSGGEPLEHSLFINNMTETDMEKLYKLVKGVTSIGGGEGMDLKKVISDTVAQYTTSITDIVGKLSDSGITNGTMRIDMFETVLDFSGLNEGKAEADKITASDMILTLAGVVASDANKAINTDHAWQNQYKDTATDKVVYDINRTDKENLVDYKQEFVNELAKKYLLNLSGADKEDPTDDITFNDLMSLFGIGETETEKKLELLDLLDITKLGDVIGNSNNRVQINDRMLGAILNEQILSQLSKGDGNIISLMKPTLEYVIITTEGEADNLKNIIELGLTANLKSVMGDLGGISDMIGNLISTKVMLVIRMDITPDATEYLKTEIKYNDLSLDKTQRILKTVSKFGVNLELDTLCTSIEKPVRDAISMMSSIIPIKLCNSNINIDETSKALPPAIEFGSIFETIDQMMFKDATDESINAESIEKVLDGINKAGKDTFEQSFIKNAAAENYDNFNAEIKTKYYIASESFSFDELFSGNSSLLNSGSFNTANFDFTSANGLFYDTREADQLKPIFTDNELAALMRDKMSADPSLSAFSGMEIKELTITEEGKMRLIIKLNISSLLGEGNADKLKLLPADVIYLTATINTAEINYLDSVTGEACADTDANAMPYYTTTLSLNEMSDVEYDVLNAMLKHLNGGTDQLDLSRKANDIGNIVYTQLNNLTASMGAGAFEIGTFTVTENGTEKTVGGLRLMGFYNFLAKSLNLTDSQPEVVKAALQGLMAKDETKPNANGYTEANIVNNPAGGVQSENVKVVGGTIYTTDRYFANSFKTVVADTADFELMQVSIYNESNADIKAFFEESYSHYVAFTYKMTNFVNGADPSNKLLAVLPEEIFVTIIIPYENFTNTYGSAALRINSLSAAQQKALMQIMGSNTLVDEQLEKVSGELSKSYTNVKYGVKSDSGLPFDADLEFSGYMKTTITLP